MSPQKRRSNAFRFCAVLASLCFSVLGADAVDARFGARHFERDLRTHVARGIGNAWLKYGDKEAYADEMEWNSEIRKATLKGNVHIIDGSYDIWCEKAEFMPRDDKATLEEATVSSGQLVMMGKLIRKLSKKEFEIENGSYTNCNVDLIKDKNVGKCQFDWKLYGRRFSITLESYAHIHDAIIYVNQLPVFYSPYFVAPIKTKRQTGLLIPQFIYTANLGSGTSIPYFQVLGPWHDLTLTPTWYSKTGYHLGIEYEYNYSGQKYGLFDLYAIQRRLPQNPDTSRPPDDPSRPRAFGVLGDGAVNARNVYNFGERGQSRQIFHLVTNPFYYYDYGADLHVEAALSWQRSQISLWNPTDDTLLTGRVMYHQPLIISKDSVADKGAIAQLPTLSAIRTTSSLFRKYFSYEVDTTFSNYYRSSEFDNIPDEPNPSGPNQGNHPVFSSNDYGSDYLRVGRRLQIEPRLITNVPVPTGLQFQPILTAGTLAYQFDLPSPQALHREYLQTELPFALYLHRNFDTNIEGYEKVSHVFQPRVIYGSSLYSSPEPDHPFFYRHHPINTSLFTPGMIGTPTTYTNPRFDYIDQLPSYEYARVELINRFRRKSKEGVKRFLLLQVSQQYNIRTTDVDSTYSELWGPLEIFSIANIWRFEAQLEARYHWMPTTFTSAINGLTSTNVANASQWSATMVYRSPHRDFISLNTRLDMAADPTQTQQSVYLTAFKTLPVFFDVVGNMEYDMRHGNLLGFQIGLLFASKPRSCWGLEFLTGQNALHQPFAFINFKLDFANPGSGPTPL